MATLSVQTITRASGGLNPTYSSCDASGDEFPNITGGTFIHVKNSSGGALDVVASTPAQVGPSSAPIDIDDETYSIPASGERMLGPFESQYFNDTDNNVNLTYPGGVTGLTIAVLSP